MGDFGRVAKKLEQLPEKIEEETSEQAHEEVFETEVAAQRNLRRNNTTWNDDIADSMKTVSYTNGEYEGGQLIISARHGPYVEYGTGAYFGTSMYPLPDTVSPIDSPDGVTDEMVENITDWISTKPVTPTYYESTSDLAQAISHTIAAVGTQSQPYIRPAWYKRRQQAIENIHNAAKDVIEDEF